MGAFETLGYNSGMSDSPEAGVQLSIVIPAWNEAANLQFLLPKLNEVGRGLNIATEVIVADAGSVDNTPEIAARNGASVVVQKERGYGGALIAGFEACRAPYVVTMDADLSHPTQFVSELWKHRHGADVLIASRYVPGGCAEMSRSRHILSLVLNRTFRLLLALPFQDLSSGFRQYNRKVLIGLPLVARDFDVLEEILIRIYSNGGTIREVPFHYQPRGAGASHARLIKFGWAYVKTLGRMWKLRRNPPSR